MSPNVLIQPSLGNSQSRKNFDNTLKAEVEFTAGALRAALTDGEFAALSALHPSGKARFWATTHIHDKKMDEISSGDVVLFTGKNHVQAVGEVCVSFRNAEAGIAMWPPDKKNGAFQNIYSLLNFVPTQLPYEDLRKLTNRPGSTGGDNFMGARLLKDDAARRVIDGLLINTTTAYKEVLQQQHGQWIAGTVVGDEAHNAESARPSSPHPGFVAERTESALVVDFKEFLTETGDSREQGRLKSVVGFSDLYLIP